MEINSLMRFSQHGWQLSDVGLKMSLARSGKATAAVPQTEEPASAVQKTAAPILQPKDSLTLSKDAQLFLNAARGEKTEELKQHDQEVRAHEHAHKAAAGQYAGNIQYDYETGEDGKQYAVGGHVSIDTTPEETPEETVQKAETVKRAALAPKDPSPQDMKVAQQAEHMAQQAQAEMAQGIPPEMTSASPQAAAAASAHAPSASLLSHAMTASQQMMTAAYLATAISLSQNVNMVA